MKQAYLGDSVYIDQLPFGYEIYTNIGLGRENVICLEPDVLETLQNFVLACKIENSERDNADNS